jgi:hypothetical protein
MGVVGTLISTHIPELPAGPTIILSGTVFLRYRCCLEPNVAC